MYKNNKKLFVLAGIALTFVLGACGSSEKLVTDTGSSSQKEIGKEEYLDLDALNNPKTETNQGNYKVLTLEKGTFAESALKQTLGRAYINIPTVELEVKEGEVKFGEYLIEGWMQSVESGDVIATIQTEVDELTIEEAELKLTRLKERYQKAETKLAEDLEDLKFERTITYNDYERFVIDVKCKQLQLDWEKAKRNYEKQIADASEKLSDLRESKNSTTVTAPVGGYVIFSTKHAAGKEMENGDYICHILTSDDFYVQTSNQAEQFAFGMTVNFRNMDEVVEGTVISGGSPALYGNLDTGKATFSVGFSDTTPSTNWRQADDLVMEGNLKTVENVVLIPKQAVTVEDDNYYVTVLKEDGNLLKTEFIPGGSNSDQYWVYEGLEEGTQIVY